MSIRTEIDRIKAAKSAIATAIAGKDVTVPAGTKLDGMAALIESIEAGGESLPVGVSALASGTVTPTADHLSLLSITHNLGVAPNFLVWWDTTDYSDTAGTTLGYWGAVVEKDVKNSSTSAIVSNHHYSVHGYNANSSAGQTGSRASDATRMTDTIATLVCNSTYPIKAGHTYRWVCGVIDGIN